MNPKVDEFLNRATQWGDELRVLRSIALTTGLTEELKWRQPCYTLNGTNVFIISAFKDHCVVSFLKGVLLADPEKVLIRPGENSQSVRFMSFTSSDQIVQQEATIKAYMFEAIELEKAGLKVELRSNDSLELVDELHAKFAQSPEFKTAFEALTPGRKRAYNIFFEAAKQSKTREDRIEKYVPRIMNGKGMNDCVCGLSKRMPNCDGSHKVLNEANQ